MPNALTETSRRPLWREREVHRDAFIDPEVFALEMQTVFTHTWVFVGHASQIPQPGDYATTTVGDQPVVMVRQWDGGISVLHNRCAHKGVKVAGREQGNTGKFFRCPYHAWTFKLDGSVLAIPLKTGYDRNGFEGTEAALGMAPVGAVQVYRTAGAAPENIQVRGGFAEVGENGLTVLAEHVEG